MNEDIIQTLNMSRNIIIIRQEKKDTQIDIIAMNNRTIIPVAESQKNI